MTTVVVAVGPTVLSGAGGPALATPSGSSSTPHGAALAGSGGVQPAAARSRPPFTGERRTDHAGGKHRAPGPADPALHHGGPALSGTPSTSAAEPSAAPTPTTTPSGGSTSGGGGAGDGGSGGDGVRVEVDDDGVTVDSGLTGPVEVPLPRPSLGS